MKTIFNFKLKIIKPQVWFPVNRFFNFVQSNFSEYSNTGPRSRYKIEKAGLVSPPLALNSMVRLLYFHVIPGVDLL